MPTDRLCHQEVILLARSVHTRRTIDDIRKIRYALQIPLRFQFAKAIGGIGHRGILFRNRSIGLFTYRTEYAQGTDKDKLPGNHVQLPQRVYKTFGLPVVHTFEVVLIYTFCSSGTVDNVIELTIQFLMTGKLRTKLTGMRKVEFKKMYLLVLQIDRKSVV